mmetsp:Transcript_15578/g.26801  ORF Transcript_15578/g.26801 Transcript_15578/m.26801 type:complete len:120 (+) Transcript_15578:390-749(+)
MKTANTILHVHDKKYCGNMKVFGHLSAALRQLKRAEGFHKHYTQYRSELKNHFLPLCFIPDGPTFKGPDFALSANFFKAACSSFCFCLNCLVSSSSSSLSFLGCLSGFNFPPALPVIAG